jgi:glutamyl-tRNA synthetase
VALVVAPDGGRLEKRKGGVTVRELLAAGVSPERILGELAFGLGLTATNAPTTARAVARAWSGRDIAWRREPWPIPEALLVGG